MKVRKHIHGHIGQTAASRKGNGAIEVSCSEGNLRLKTVRGIVLEGGNQLEKQGKRGGIIEETKMCGVAERAEASLSKEMP